MLNMETKPLIQSRTFWVAVATFVAGVLTLIPQVFGAYIPSEVAGALLSILGLLNIFLRSQTSIPIQGMK